MKRLLPLLVLLALMAIVYGLGAQNLLSFETLKARREELIAFVAAYPLIAPLLFVGIYIVAVALSVPGAIFLTLGGGFVFPQPYSTLYVIVGASTGACIVFQVAKTSLAAGLKERLAPSLVKMQRGFQDNAASYLLFLRFVPIFPFWLVNLAPAFLGVRFFTFAWTTALGITPGSFVFCQAGAGLGSIFDSGDTFSLGALLTGQMKVALVTLGLFSLLPIFVKRWYKITP